MRQWSTGAWETRSRWCQTRVEDFLWQTLPEEIMLRAVKPSINNNADSSCQIQFITCNYVRNQTISMLSHSLRIHSLHRPRNHSRSPQNSPQLSSVFLFSPTIISLKTNFFQKIYKPFCWCVFSLQLA